jgi:phosphoglycolate phosphatase-like HAD superfamily hydrolase
MYLASRPKRSMTEDYKSILPRILFQIGIPVAEIPGLCTEDDVEYIVHQMMYQLVPRPGLREMMSILEEGGVEFWACSGASAERVQHYFELAGIPFDARRIWEDSTLGVHKPNRKVYEALKEDMEKRAPGQVGIFVGEC